LGWISGGPRGLWSETGGGTFQATEVGAGIGMATDCSGTWAAAAQKAQMAMPDFCAPPDLSAAALSPLSEAPDVSMPGMSGMPIGQREAVFTGATSSACITVDVTPAKVSKLTATNAARRAAKLSGRVRVLSRAKAWRGVKARLGYTRRRWCASARRAEPDRRTHHLDALPYVTAAYVTFVGRDPSLGAFTGLTNGFFKRLEKHKNASALHFADYNFVRIHQTLRMTPAVAAGVTDKLWEMADLVTVVEAADKPAVRGPYKKQAA
jgi:hypothetical protein